MAVHKRKSARKKQVARKKKGPGLKKAAKNMMRSSISNRRI